jgi:drug/metabolite transporter (DMT)-like permease
MRSERVGILLILLQQFLFTLDTGGIHYLSGAASPSQLGFFRSAGGLALSLCLALSGRTAPFRTHRPVLQFIRVAASAAYSWVLIYSFAVMPFGDATAISYTLAIYVVLLAPVILGEAVRSNRLVAVLFGVVGAAMVVKPGFSQGSLLYLGVFAGTSLNALAMLLTKELQRYDSATTVMFYVNGGGLLVFLPGMVADPLPTASAWPLIAAVCVAGPLGMYAGIVAVRHADASTLAPFSYVRLVLAIAGSALLFGEFPDLPSIAGAICIFVACLSADRELISLLIRWANRGIPAKGQTARLR